MKHLTIQIPKDLHYKFKGYAHRQKTSMTKILTAEIEEHIAEEEWTNRITEVEKKSKK